MCELEPLAFVPTLARLFPESQDALRLPLFSHRTEMFDRLFRASLKQLSDLCGNPEFHTIMCAGTGTLANDIMVWNFADSCRAPLVLVNGEFGTRLARQCALVNADTQIVNLPWGTPIDAETVKQALKNHPKTDALFAVANESSCAQMLDITALETAQLPIYLDGVSAVGVQDAFFHSPHVRCVSASSGKALAALPGISILYYCDEPKVSAHRPATVDLVSLIDALHSLGGVRNTFGSLQLNVLHAALNVLLKRGVPDYAAHLHALKNTIVTAFAAHGITPFPNSTSPMMTAFYRPENWTELRGRWADAGIEVYEHPRYLQKNGLFEIATMGDFTENEVNRLLNVL